MVGVFSFLLVVSIIALVVAVVRLVISAVKKESKKPSAVMAAVSVVLLLVSFVGVGLTYHPTPEQIAERERIAAEKAEQERIAEEAARKEAEEAAHAESRKPIQSETSANPSAESEPSSSPAQDFALDFNSLTTSDIGKLDTGNLELKFGELLDVTYGGDGVVVVKAKITPNLTNKMTIQQNYHSICELITDHGFDSCRELQYWAVADMADGSEGKVISFTLDSDTILGVANQTILPINLDGYLQDLWILPSLLG